VAPLHLISWINNQLIFKTPVLLSLIIPPAAEKSAPLVSYGEKPRYPVTSFHGHFVPSHFVPSVSHFVPSKSPCPFKVLVRRYHIY